MLLAATRIANATKYLAINLADSSVIIAQSTSALVSAIAIPTIIAATSTITTIAIVDLIVLSPLKSLLTFLIWFSFWRQYQLYSKWQQQLCFLTAFSSSALDKIRFFISSFSITIINDSSYSLAAPLTIQLSE